MRRLRRRDDVENGCMCQKRCGADQVAGERKGLIKWLVNEKGADVNGRSSVGLRPLSGASCPDVIMALLECGADPLTKSRTGCTPLIECAMSGYVDCVARLLEDPRVRAKIN